MAKQTSADQPAGSLSIFIFFVEYLFLSLRCSTPCSFMRSENEKVRT
jgi:hypothetical protein